MTDWTDTLSDDDIRRCLPTSEEAPPPSPPRRPGPAKALAYWNRRGDHHTRDHVWMLAAWEARGDADALDRAEAIADARERCTSPYCDHATGADCLFWVAWHEARIAERRRGELAKADRLEAAAFRVLTARIGR